MDYDKQMHVYEAPCNAAARAEGAEGYAVDQLCLRLHMPARYSGKSQTFELEENDIEMKSIQMWGSEKSLGLNLDFASY